ncbi:type IV pilus secretin PilQ [Noviherbaspirillum suwonense]|jgi:type IV pilus assembly protein PilQ|uniref:Type IV pilus biogenesis and competence protein PilQ n=1 Tax=Noviherbaspirillum suwonense TaxID=1224511 RepID=A0ABY1PYJ4_9BURK|nr:type IV pilus secretin PilQ [Noviherbaspirillum suwonense]SMP53080.1 type IV pilus assembly protein PilQ [Noviherbaspirillum suwonense]
MMNHHYRSLWQACAAVCIAGAFGVSHAQENAIESISANQQGANVIVKIAMKNPVQKPPIGFSITSPARIALDFAGTSSSLNTPVQEVGIGDVRSVNIVQAGERSRLVFNLNRPLNYATAVDGNTVIVTIDGTGGVPRAVNAAGVPVAQAAQSTQAAPAGAPAGKPAIRDIDFRRGTAGEGRVVIDLPGNQVGVDVRQQGQNIVVDFAKTALPEMLRRRLDVGDFGTPVRTITATSQGENVRMVIEPKGLWEHSAYQSDSQLVVEVRPLKEEPNKLSQGTQGYRGEKLSLNFQNVEVRAVLQVIADFTGLNIITSDTVAGNLTLRLKDVPWDQALDIVMQAKGLDMRKNGNVLWIAPKDELLTKEKLELEQRSQIAELEPLRTETFQLNYQKAESFKTLLDNAGGNGRSILSKRGSAVIDPRTNQLFVTDITSKVEEIRKLVQKTDIASRQVLIEARIVEANDTFSRDLGAKLGFGIQNNHIVAGGQQGIPGTGPTPVGGNSVNLPTSTSSGLSPGSVALTLFNTAATRFISLELQALESDGKGKILSSPRVITADQLKATIEQGTELPYQTATSSGATALSFRKANLKLEVIPQITPDGNVILDVDVNKDSVGQNTASGLAIDTKHVKTQVLIENGGTVVIGGIYIQEDRDTINKVPVLGDIPVMGNLFKSTSRRNNKTELLIFLTPKVLSDKLAVR